MKQEVVVRLEITLMETQDTIITSSSKRQQNIKDAKLL